MINKIYNQTLRRLVLWYEVGRQVKRDCKGMKNILDVGCGVYPVSSKLGKNIIKTGVDIMPRERIIDDKLDFYKRGDITKLRKIFKPRSFDLVCCTGVIEHLKKEDGWKLIQDLERIAKKKIIITTPNGFLPQIDKENSYQNHLSGWDTGEFRKLGYTVTGMHGWKKLRGSHAFIKYKPKWFWIPFADFTQLFLKNKPELCFQLYAIKRR